MNRSTTLGRKIVYLLVLIAMLIPLYMLGQPPGGSGDSGGKLSEMRLQYNIAESDLGEISPASETMKLATLGLRGVAATLLWNKAHEYRVLHEWDRLKATLNNIALLQPHFDRVWEHQAHNLAYNVSIEFDDYRQRYEMVREGTEFLTRGVRQNRRAPRLIWYTGWFYGAKLGMSDEKRQFRRLFSDDELQHAALLKENIAVDSPEARGPLGKPDNWLVGRLWLFHGYDLVDGGVRIRRQTPLNFFETGPKWRFKHAEAIEQEGILDESAQNAWAMAADDWAAFGKRSIPTTSPFTIKLDELEVLKEQKEERLQQFRELTGEVYERERQKRIDGLPDDVKEFWQLPESEMTYRQRILMPAVMERLIPDLANVARQCDPDVRLQAVNLVGEINDLDERIKKTEGYRTQINYPYWKALAAAEQEERTVRARRLIYEAEKANEAAELDEAIKLYEEAFAIWAEIFDTYPLLTIDDTAEDLHNSVRRYMVAIDSQEIPDDFPLKTFVEMMEEEGEIDSETYRMVREESLRNAELRRKQAAELLKQQEAEKSDGESNGDASGESSDDQPDEGEPDEEDQAFLDPIDASVTWQTSLPHGTHGSPRPFFFDDGTPGMLIDYGREDIQSGGVMAVEIATGQPRWEYKTEQEMFTLPVPLTPREDGRRPWVFGGRAAQLHAVDVRNGQRVWRFTPFNDAARDEGILNFYTGLEVDDVNDDGIRDFLVTNGGDYLRGPREPRPVSHILILSGDDGTIIHKIEVPESRETYCSPLIWNRKDTQWLVFGSGGETFPGSMWGVPLENVLEGSLKGRRRLIYNRGAKGTLAPPAIADLDKDGQLDLIATPFDGRIVVLSGDNLKTMWEFSDVDVTETQASPAVGDFDGDGDLDVAYSVQVGVFPEWTSSILRAFDGATGSPLWEHQTGTNLMGASILAADIDSDHKDELLFLHASPAQFKGGGKSKAHAVVVHVDEDRLESIADLPGFNGATGWVGDADQDGLLEWYIPMMEPDQTGSLVRLDLGKPKPKWGVAWGGYLGTQHDGTYAPH